MKKIKLTPISIIMPVYNESEKYLKDSIESMLSQSYKDFEFVIIDDSGKYEHVYKFIKKYEKKDKRIKIIKNERNLGLMKSLNIGLRNSKGRYIVRMDGDDISDKERVKKQKKFLDDNKDIMLVGTFAKIINEEGEIKAKYSIPVEYKEIRKQIFLRNVFLHSAWMFRRELIELIGSYNEDYKQAEDYDFIMRVVLKYKCANIPEFLLYWRRRNGQMTDTRWFKTKLSALRIRLKALRFSRLILIDIINIIVSFVILFIPPDLIIRMVSKNEKN